jgi:hypothetical protein
MTLNVTTSEVLTIFLIMRRSHEQGIPTLSKIRQITSD